VDFTALSLAHISTGLEGVARDSQSVFGSLSARQLNWRPDVSQWSAAQCFDHLLTVNRLIVDAADTALSARATRTIWQRLPVLPRVLGKMLIRSQSPDGKRRFVAPATGQPSSSEIPPDVVQRFVSAQADVVRNIRALDEGEADRTIMTSPFVIVITYSVLDAYRLLFAHECRHFEQARRVTQSQGFPSH
jgi:DinB superfamily